MFSAWVNCFCGAVVAMKVGYDDESHEYEATTSGLGDVAQPTVLRPPDWLQEYRSSLEGVAVDAYPQHRYAICVASLCPTCENLVPARFIRVGEEWKPETISGFELIGRLDRLMLRQATAEEFAPLVGEVDAALEEFPDEPFLWEWKDFLLAGQRPDLDDDERCRLQVEALDNLIRLNPTDDFSLCHRADYAGQGGLWACKSMVLSGADRYEEAIEAMKEAVRLHPEDDFLKDELTALHSLAEDN